MIDLQKNWPYENECLASDFFLNIDGIPARNIFRISGSFLRNSFTIEKKYIMSTQVGTRKFLHMRVIKYLRKMWRFWKKTNVSHLILFCSIYVTLREKCPYSELFWSTFSHIRSEFEEILQSDCRKMWTTITPNTDTFYAMLRYK